VPLYTLVSMASVRTQVYLTVEQRARLDELAQSQGTSLAALVRLAVDQFLAEEGPDPVTALNATFATMPDLEVADRAEWDRG
jgi:predicted DNA-binding protein